MRGVLLDIIYSRDSYFATLREYTEEIALEDTFVFINDFKKKLASYFWICLLGQKWVQNLMREVPTTSGGSELIATHLTRWLKIEDGSEAFFELELARGSLCPFAQVVGEDLDDDGPDQLFAGVPTRLKFKPVRAKRRGRRKK
ncbi:uncharacterized protein PITG_07463 [Phytophthora infestans T30-4]|uniref:Uncharacterized protein n=1 Tax=Phytophthora infestans (strain T30-4) TaxID=403677 RepID=D0N8G5_PHYIT|nr:uncharacterized protein PITG_07463 [Phytophthora infestans T30-4]EEY53850.1 conserved hypothetical protein [Phytophthora infestans T30-4]|eukprot:XP_002904481.1 conserved hypothetical protein [Phytophthora infestans T30-4]